MIFEVIRNFNNAVFLDRVSYSVAPVALKHTCYQGVYGDPTTYPSLFLGFHNASKGNEPK